MTAYASAQDKIDDDIVSPYKSGTIDKRIAQNIHKHGHVKNTRLNNQTVSYSQISHGSEYVHVKFVDRQIACLATVKCQVSCYRTITFDYVIEYITFNM